MIPYSLIIQLSLLSLYSSLDLKVKNAKAAMDFMEIFRYNNYLAEEHFVTISDGYILR